MEIWGLRWKKMSHWDPRPKARGWSEPPPEGFLPSPKFSLSLPKQIRIRGKAAKKAAPPNTISTLIPSMTMQTQKSAFVHVSNALL